LAIGGAEFEDLREESSLAQGIDLRHEGRYEFAVQGEVDLALLASGQPSVGTVGRFE
jgi:hypothetical protein